MKHRNLAYFLLHFLRIMAADTNPPPGKLSYFPKVFQTALRKETLADALMYMLNEIKLDSPSRDSPYLRTIGIALAGDDGAKVFLHSPDGTWRFIMNAYQMPNGEIWINEIEMKLTDPATADDEKRYGELRLIWPQLYNFLGLVDDHRRFKLSDQAQSHLRLIPAFFIKMNT